MKNFTKIKNRQSLV